MDPSKLKVVDLRQELQQRGLDTKGVKAALVKRLKDAMEKESAEGSQNNTLDSAPKEKDISEGSIEESQDDDGKDDPDEVKSPDKTESNDLEKSISNESKSPKIEKTPVTSPEKNKVKAEVPSKTEQSEEPSTETEAKKVEGKPDENGEHVNESNTDQQAGESTKKQAKKNVERNGKRKRRDSFELEERSSKKPREREPIVVKEDEPDINYEKVQISWYDSDLNLQVDKETFISAKPLTDGCFGFIWAGARATYGVTSGKVCFEIKITEELKWEDPSKDMVERKDRDRGKHKSDRHKEHDKSKRDDSKHKSPEKKPEEEKIENSIKKEIKTENSEEPTETATNESMDTTEKDAEVDIKSESVPVKEEKESEEVVAEDKVAEENDVDTEKKEETEQPCQEKEKEVVKEIVKEPIPVYYFRVGFSLPGTTLQLGETKYSYAYESTGKFITDKQFQDYGVTFGVGDVVGAYLSIDDEQVIITYTVNGALQPTAITIPRSELPEESFSLFPHVLCRNFAYELNFGNREEAWFPHPEELKDYTFLQSIADKVSGPKRPEKRNECELILMIGLSGSGKTHWAKQHIESTKDKTYTIIGNDSIFERMTVDGQSFRSRFSGSWKVLVDKLQKCLNSMTDVAALRRRNVIIDQTNVFPQAQNRKLRAFEGFKRKAVCVICGDEELARRHKSRDNDNGKTIPESTLLEQKGQIELPQKFSGLELIFPDLSEEESKKMIRKYHEEFQEKGHHRRGYNNRRDHRRSYYQQNNYRDNRGYGRYERYSQGSWGRSSTGGWGRDRRDSRGPPQQSRHGGNSGWRQSRGPRADERSRSREGSSRHSYGGSRNQSGRGEVWASSGGGSGWGGQGGWNQQMFGSHGYGAWNQQGWKYNSGQGGGGYSGYNGQGNGGYGQQGWNYYGQYSQQQGWGGGHQGRK